jgi:hypothetical protein
LEAEKSIKVMMDWSEIAFVSVGVWGRFNDWISLSVIENHRGSLKTFKNHWELSRIIGNLLVLF